jgi:Arc/MetJ-type ribon-helix-helix transcriptional regulator
MTTRFLTVRLGQDDAGLVDRLRERTGLSQSDVVKQALRAWASAQSGGVTENLFSLGEGRFGRHGDASRQSRDIKRVVRARLDAKRSSR